MADSAVYRNTMEDNIFEYPHNLVSSIPPEAFLILFGALAIAAVGIALSVAVRRGEIIPLASCAGALVCALNEPIYDVLGKIVYAENHFMAFENFGREIPWFLVLGYIPWVGLLPYVIARMMAAGTPRRTLHLIALGSFVSVVAVETLGTSLDGWEYYGEAPLKFLVVAPQMAPVPIVGGLLLYVVAQRFRGWRRAVAAFVISTLALPMVFASASWPLYVGLYADLPAAIDWLTGIAMLSLSILVVTTATDIAQRAHASENRTLQYAL